MACQSFDSGIMAALKNAEVEMLDASLEVYRELGVMFETCPVAVTMHMD